MEIAVNLFFNFPIAQTLFPKLCFQNGYNIQIAISSKLACIRFRSRCCHMATQASKIMADATCEFTSNVLLNPKYK